MSVDSSRFQFIADALHRSGGFQNGGYLVQYPRESEDKFTKRKELAWYENKLKPGCERFGGYLAARPPIRDTANNQHLDVFASNADWKGNSLDVVISDFVTEAKARGSMLMLVDNPQQQVDTQAEQLEQRVVPYLVPIKPEDVAAFEINSQGLFEFVEINSTHVIDDEETAVVRRWDTEGWAIKEEGEEGEIIESGEHGLGVCPVLAFTESGTYPVEGEFSQVADLSKRLYNMHSELDEILRAQTFSLLTYEVPADQMHTFDKDKQDQVTAAVGTHNMLIYPGERPGFIAPPSGPADTYMTRIENLEHRIDLITHNPVARSSSQNESGYALSLKFQALNSSLTKFARRLEDFERRVFGLVGLWLGIENRAKVNYPKDYQLADLATEIEILQNMVDAGAPQEYIDAKMKQIISMDLTGLDKAELQIILDAIANSTHERGTGEGDE